MVWAEILSKVLGNAGQGPNTVPVQVSQQPTAQLDFAPEAARMPRQEPMREEEPRSIVQGMQRPSGGGRYYR